MDNALVGFFEYVIDYIKDTPVTSDERSMLDLLDKDEDE